MSTYYIFESKQTKPKVTQLLNSRAVIVTRAVRLHACALTTLDTGGRRRTETECERMLARIKSCKKERKGVSGGKSGLGKALKKDFKEGCHI